ncbi:REP element-mobilizing transposase RayT [Abditibacterium utsteinense]|uniref:REP element-mobilizing transposase RayT n=2 Tax=Abditibacterium utsteinense TaxID=1960156 RepID=A0A2S8SWT7_9BACT|nr:REP element-mobilizing transposase RayT [Abditibacterium utsteinense]
MNNRYSFRYRDYDYRRNGAYHVVICSHERRNVFGEIRDGQMRLNRFGIIVDEEWYLSSEKRAEIVLDTFVIMPNHVHGLVFIAWPDDQTFEVPPETPVVTPASLGAFVRGFKSAVTKRIGEQRGQQTLVWQRLYWDRIIRDERELENTRRYIEENPAQWENDELNAKP